MKHCSTILLATTIVVVAGYLASIVTVETLPKAADRYGKAVLLGDTVSLWSFVPDDERAYYGFDQKKFATFWTRIIQPHLKSLDTFHIQSASNNGLIVICESSKGGEQTPQFGILISGQMGNYYAPYIVGYSSLAAAGLEMKASNAPKYRRFEQYVTWIKQNKAELESIGMPKMRRGPAFPGETLDEMRVHFEKIAASERIRTKLASR